MRIKQFLIAVCVGTMLAACSSKEDYTTETERVPIRINASIKGIKTRSEGQEQLQNTSFVDEAEINVYVVDEGDNSAPGIPESGYAVYKKNGSSWTSDATVYTFGSDMGMDVFAIYPSKDKDGNYITKNSTTFEVEQEQKLDENYRKSDLMYATYSTSQPNIDLEFEHCLSKITVILSPSSEFTQEKLESKVGSIVLGAKRGATINANWGIQVTGTTSIPSGNLVTFNGSNDALCSTGVSCIIPPQEIAGNKTFIQIQYDDDSWFTFKSPSAGFNFKGGNEYIFTLTLEQTGVTLSDPTIQGWTTNNHPGVAK